MNSEPAMANGVFARANSVLAMAKNSHAEANCRWKLALAAAMMNSEPAMANSVLAMAKNGSAVANCLWKLAFAATMRIVSSRVPALQNDVRVKGNDAYDGAFENVDLRHDHRPMLPEGANMKVTILTGLVYEITMI